MNDEMVELEASNGVPVIIQRSEGSGIAGLMICVGSGSRDERSGSEGLSHLLEHMLFKGTSRRSARDISTSIEASGGELNGFTSREMTAYYAVTLADGVDIASDVLGDMFTDPSMREGDLSLEREVVAREISMWREEPDTYIHTLSSRTLWGDHPMGRDEAGDEDVVRSLTREDLVALLDERYGVGNVAVVACGDVDTDRLLDWTGSLDLGEAKPPERIGPVPIAREVSYPREGEGCYVGMALPGLPFDHPDFPALKVTSAILGAGMGSRLFQSVREERGMVYSIYTMARGYSDTGSVTTFFSTSKDRCEEVNGEVVSEIEDLVAEGPEPGEVRRAINLLQGNIVRTLESTEMRMHRIGRSLMTMGRPLNEEDELRAYGRVTDEDVMDVAGRVLDCSRLAVAIHGPSS